MAYQKQDFPKPPSWDKEYNALTLTKVAELKDKYAFIITTKTRTIDTSKYPSMIHHNAQINTIMGSAKHMLILSTKPGLSSGHYDVTGDEELLIILDDSVKSITVKQVKGHPWSGQPGATS